MDDELFPFQYQNFTWVTSIRNPYISWYLHFSMGGIYKTPQLIGVQGDLISLGRRGSSRTDYGDLEFLRRNFQHG